MTQPDDITVSLEMARKLKEVGWPMSYSDIFAWWEDSEGNAKVERTSNLALTATSNGLCFPAPSAEEILRRLPGNLKLVGYDAYLQFMILPGTKWLLTYMGKTEPTGQTMMKHDTLANAAAACWIYLANNGLLPKAYEAA